MRRVVLHSSRMIASTFNTSPPKPWHILQCHTWHAAETSNQSARTTSSWPLPLGQPSCKMEEMVHLNQMPHFTPPFHSSPFLGHPMNGFVAPPSHAGDYRSDAKDMRKTRHILELAHLHGLKEKLQKETPAEVVAYDDLLKMCVSTGAASSSNRASQLVKCLDDASLILILQDIVYLNPLKVAQLVSKVMPTPSSLKGEREGTVQEIHSLKEEKEDIDKLAYKYARRVLWLGFGYLTLQMLLIFWLTFWELSWDVMEPIAYFVTNITLLVGYAFFMTTSKHPSYRNLCSTLCSSKQQKLMRRRNFDMAKFLELQRHCEAPFPSLRSSTSSH